jgi:hypothetical protein
MKGVSQFGLKGKFIRLAPPSLLGKGAGGLGLFAKLRCSQHEEISGHKKLDV